ncbi:MAG: sensor histidine kinase [Dermatophilaceae bacterium]
MSTSSTSGAAEPPGRAEASGTGRQLPLPRWDNSWRVLTDGTVRGGSTVPPPRRVLLHIVVSALVVLMIVVVAGLSATRHAAEDEGLRDAAARTDLLAVNVVVPALEADLWSPRQWRRDEATNRLRRALILAAGSEEVASIKVWDPDGTILCSDDRSLIGRRYDLPASTRVDLSDPRSRSAVTDLARPEHANLRRWGRLLEVYRPVVGPENRTVLVETYSTYDSVEKRTNELWRGFAALTALSLVALLALLLPLIWRIVRRARSEREELLQRSVDASLDERRRIAGDLHDGVIQVLAAATVSMDDLACRARGHGAADVDDDLRTLATEVRGTVHEQRALLVDLYPPSLAEEGLRRALEHLAEPLRADGVDATVDIKDSAAAALDLPRQELAHRIVQEVLRNVAAHARASAAWVRLWQEHDRVLVEVSDNGVGFDPDRAIDPATGHIGTRVVIDLARDAGARLALRTAPGAGTAWLLEFDLTSPRTPRSAGHGGRRGWRGWRGWPAAQPGGLS